MRWADISIQQTLADLSAAGLSAAQIAVRIRRPVGATKNAMARYGLFAQSRPKKDKGAWRGDGNDAGH